VGLTIFGIFSYSLIFYPRTKSYFWSIVLYYLLGCLFFKFLFQIEIISTPDDRDNSEIYLVMQEVQVFFKMLNYEILITSDEFHEQIRYYYTQFIGISLILILRTLLIQKGLWDKTENEYEKIKEVDERLNKFQKIIDVNEELNLNNIEVYKEIINDFIQSQLKEKEEKKDKKKIENKYYKPSSQSSYLRNIFRKYEVIK